VVRQQSWLMAVVGIFLMGCAFFLVVGCSGETGSQSSGSQNSEESQSAETRSEQTRFRESESTYEATEPGGSQASEGSESTHEVAQHGESVEAIPSNTLTDSLLKVNGITYDAVAYYSASVLHDEDLGPKVAEVSPEMNKESTNPTTTYSALPDEVPVYAIKGYDPSFRVAARMDDDLRAFEVLYNPKAKEGSDILDIGGKVIGSIGISHDIARGVPPPPVGSIDNPNKVERLVQSLMDAPIKPTSPDYYGTENLDHYGITFGLKDGTYERFEYRMDTGRLSKVPENGPDIPTSGLVAPRAFREAIKEGVDKRYQREIESEKLERSSCSDPRTSHEVRRADSSGGSLGANEEAYTTNDVDPGGPWGGMLRGTEKNDKLLGEGGEDEIHGLGGNDTVDGGACGDKIYGGPGNDDLVGDKKQNIGSVGGGVEAKSGKDVLYGGDGDDTLSPDKDGQQDKLYCGKGYDKAWVGSVADKIDYVDDSCEKKEEWSTVPY
jgi:hypothetical protein